LDTALVANHPAVFHALVFSAQALPVGDRAKNLGAEKSIAFRLKSPIIDSFRFGDFAMGPRTDLFGRSQADANSVELADQTDSIIRAAAEHGLPPHWKIESRNSKFETRNSSYFGKLTVSRHLVVRKSKFETRKPKFR